MSNLRALVAGLLMSLAMKVGGDRFMDWLLDTVNDAWRNANRAKPVSETERTK